MEAFFLRINDHIFASTMPMSKRDALPWTYLTNHTHVLVCLAKNPDLVLRQVALTIGITERAVQRIVADLERAGALTRIKEGRRNRYRINFEARLRHSMESHLTIGQFLDLICNDD